MARLVADPLLVHVVVDAREDAHHLPLTDVEADVRSHRVHEAVVAVAGGADRNVELHPVIDLIGLRAAEIPRNAGGADHRAREAPGDRVVLVDHADVDVALLEDAVVRDEADRVLEQMHPVIEPVAKIDEQLFRQIVANAARPEVIGVHDRVL